MAQDPLFEQRIAEALKAQGAKPEHKKMFGGVAFMVQGNMSVGITNKGDFMVRFDGSRHAEISKWPGTKPMTFGKGDMKGFLFVDADAVESPKALEKWVTLSLSFVRTLPKKSSTKSATKKPAVKAATRAPAKKK
ncbi:MAG: TfoX/Sxy family protein [Flavobacteriales bacterium]|nr:TfoX/Sxy family protein [Flavobacteriales bacterium]